LPSIAIIIVTFNTGDLVVKCLDSIVAGSASPHEVIIVDNASNDDTPTLVEDWIARRAHAVSGPDAAPGFRLVRSAKNSGFAGGVNQGLALAQADPRVSHFWLLNPDTLLGQQTLAELQGGLMQTDAQMVGTRIEYIEPRGTIQSDGGLVDPRRGVCHNIHAGEPNSTPRFQGALDFISGANLVVTRRFLEIVGPMREDYFLYHEEVDWALRGRSLGVAMLDGAVVFHVGGSSIGTKTTTTKRSALSSYFLMRGRVMFMRAFFPQNLLQSMAYSLIQCLSIWVKDSRESGVAALRGLLQMTPPSSVKARLRGSTLEATWRA
jgi:GT2 family glycosyltransferase